jgi:hypothetical protein
VAGSLREGLDSMIEEQRRSLRGDPTRETRAWLEKLAALDRKRSGYLDLAAEGIMGRDELRSKLAELQEFRQTAERELTAIEERKERLEQMERDRNVLLERYAGVVPESLNALTSEERHQLYKLLRLEVVAYPDKSLEVSGAIVGGGGESGGGSSGGGPNGVIPSRGLGALELTQTSSPRRRVSSSPRPTTTRLRSSSPTARRASSWPATQRPVRRSTWQAARTPVPSRSINARKLHTILTI